MTTIVWLVRHGLHSTIDHVLVGRTPDVTLSPAGFEQARRIGRRMAAERVTCVQSSPRLRPRQTAEVLASASGLPVEIVAEVDELNAGAWTGVSFDELNRDPRWRQWNAERATARIPDGESMRDLQGRMIAHLDHVRASHPHSRVVIVSHAEPIRSAILHYRGIPLADFAKVTVEPASITTLLLHQRGGQITQENESLDAMVAA